MSLRYLASPKTQVIDVEREKAVQGVGTPWKVKKNLAIHWIKGIFPGFLKRDNSLTSEACANFRASPAISGVILLTAFSLPLNEAIAADETAQPPPNLADKVGDRVKDRLSKIGTEAHVELLPRWEVGMGALHLSGKDYPASDNDNERLFVVPYAVYRGEKFRIGEGGVSALAFENSRYSLDFSIAGSVNANSEDNPLREGLPDIDYMFEVGPQLIVTLADRINSDSTRTELTFSTQLRAAFSTDFKGVDSRGGVLSTSLDWERSGFMGGKLGVFAEISPTWATEELQDVFYQVDDEYVTANRSSYDAEGGYMGTDTSIGLSFKPWKNLSLYAALGKKFYAGAANEDSPLFETDSANTFWIGALWRIKSSTELVEVLRD